MSFTLITAFPLYRHIIVIEKAQDFVSLQNMGKERKFDVAGPSPQASVLQKILTVQRNAKKGQQVANLVSKIINDLSLYRFGPRQNLIGLKNTFRIDKYLEPFVWLANVMHDQICNL